ncbi:MAG: (2Fe-2S) ferredoxin domain-containing protein [Mariprofundaceae bacterium]|nr:(2Fe-2S) ferredoxin domain-containing protein [Mariprofundaceae bacterium]
MTIQICHGQNCADSGGKSLAKDLAERGLLFEKTACRSLCTYAPVVFLGGRLNMRVTVEEIIDFDKTS